MRGPFYESAYGRSVTSSGDEVAFPMAWRSTRSDFSGPLSDRRHVGHVATAIRAASARATSLAHLTQVSAEVEEGQIVS